MKVVPSSDPTIIGIYNSDGGHDATVYGFPAEDAMRKANVFAAAPAMLEALEGIEHFSDAVAYRSDTISVALREWINAGRAAIAKAKGIA